MELAEKKLYILIADDDVHMRFVLRKALEKSGVDMQILEAENGAEAVAAFDKQPIQMAFLDVDMPLLDGIEAAKMILDIAPKCILVFVTAHEGYMQEAFEMYAFDYIIKPFKLDRLKTTFEKMLEYYDTAIVPNLIVKETAKELPTEGLILKIQEGMVVLKPKEIIMIERQNRQTAVVTRNGVYHTTKTLTELENLLPKDAFIRSHKSYIIRIDQIRTIQIYGRWTYVVKFKDIEQDALLTKEQEKVLMTYFKDLTD